MEEFKEIAKQLKSLRKAKDVTQEEIAIELNTSSSFISKFESGESNPTLKTIEKYAKVLGYSVEYKFKKLKK